MSSYTWEIVLRNLIKHIKRSQPMESCYGKGDAHQTVVLMWSFPDISVALCRDKCTHMQEIGGFGTLDHYMYFLICYAPPNKVKILFWVGRVKKFFFPQSCCVCERVNTIALTLRGDLHSLPP